MTSELARVADNLAAAEERLAAAPDDMNAKATVAALRSRLARIQSRTALATAPMSAPVPPAAPQPVTTVRAAPAAPIKKDFPMTEADRVARLTTLATALGAEQKTLDAAIVDGITPDQFAVRVADKRLHDQEVEAVAQRILACAAGKPLDDEAGRVAARIAAA